MTANLVLVLGMHRSGTSALARGLRCLGVALGDALLGAHPCNPRGFFEDVDFWACNKALLSAVGLLWHDAVPIDPAALLHLAQGESGSQALALLRDKLAPHACLGLKDPRLSRLLPFWRPLWHVGGLRPHCLLSLRHPASVAHSLARRDGMEASHACALWLWHLLDAIEGSCGLPCLVVDYNTLLADPKRQIRRAGGFLGRSVDTAALEEFCSDFLDDSLCHHRAGIAGPSAPPPGQPQPAAIWEDMALRLHAALLPAAHQSLPLEDWPGYPRLLRLCRNMRQKALHLPAPGRPLQQHAAPDAESSPCASIR